MQLLHQIYNFTDLEVPWVNIEVQKQNTHFSLTLNEYSINIQLRLSYFQLCYGMTQLEQFLYILYISLFDIKSREKLKLDKFKTWMIKDEAKLLDLS